MNFDLNNVAVWDTESDGFIHDSTRIWQMCIKNRLTGEVFKYREDQIQDGIAKLNEFNTIVAHNQIKHDLPLFRKHYSDMEILSKPLDSCILSMLIRPDRPQPKGCSGAHGLAAFGILQGRPKPEHEDWSQWSPAMEHRCAEDVEINDGALNLILHEIEMDRAEGIDWEQAISVEHTVAEIISQSELNGWLFDQKAARILLDKIDTEVRAIDDELGPILPNRCVILSAKAAKKDGGHIIPSSQIFTSTGKYHANVCKYFDITPESALDFRTRLVENGQATDEEPGGYCRVSFEKIDLDSNEQTVQFLLSQGWVPTEYTPTTDAGGGGNPKLTEDSFASIKGETGKRVAHRRVLKARRRTIENPDKEEKGWMNLLREDGKLTPVNIPQGTPTGRSRHSIIANVPKNEPHVIYGKECRELFIAEPGWKILGCDASGLEARMLAHFINDENLTYNILNADIHSYNQKLAGLQTRGQAKEFYYAFLYGGGDAKIGSIIGGGSKEGKELKEVFFNNLPKLKDLIAKLNLAAKRGYLIGLDGRKMPIRSAHAALNLLLQGGGAVVMKIALCYLQYWLKCNKILLDEVQLVTFYHDEFQQQIKEHWVVDTKNFDSEEDGKLFVAGQGNIWTPVPEHPDANGKFTIHYSPIGELTVKAIRQAGEYFKLRCPLDAEYKIGNNWAETH